MTDGHKSGYQKGKSSWNLNETRDDGFRDAVASAGPCANNLHLAPDRLPHQHLITQFFTGRMLFLMPNQQCQSTHTHPFNGPFFQDYPGEPVPERWNQSGFYWSKRQWVAEASAGLYASLHLAPDRQPRQHHTTLFFTGRTPFLPPNQQRQSTEGSVLKKHWRKLKINNTQGKINEHVLKAL